MSVCQGCQQTQTRPRDTVHYVSAQERKAILTCTIFTKSNQVIHDIVKRVVCGRPTGNRCHLSPMANRPWFYYSHKTLSHSLSYKTVQCRGDIPHTGIHSCCHRAFSSDKLLKDHLENFECRNALVPTQRNTIIADKPKWLTLRLISLPHSFGAYFAILCLWSMNHFSLSKNTKKQLR